MHPKILQILNLALLPVWFLLATSFAIAQQSFEFSGYLVNLPIFQPKNNLGFIASDDILLDLTRLRLRPTFNFGENSRISLEYEITSLYQSNALFFAPVSDKTNRQTVDLRWQPVNEKHFRMAHFIDRLYLRQDFDFGNITVGRQRVAWGTGRIWNPTDLFNPINPASFDKIEKDGADLITAKFYLGNFTDLTLVHNPQKNLRENNAGFRFRSNYHTYDLSVVGGYFDERLVIGGDFAGNLLAAGFRGEAILSANRHNLNSNFVKYILGLDYQLTSKIYALVEYQHNGEGKREKAAYDLQGLIAGRIINLSKDYLFTQSIVQIHPLLSGGIGWNGNLNDGSGFTALSLTYSYRDNFEIGLGGQFFYGSQLDEYWYYGNALFLLGTFYF